MNTALQVSDFDYRLPPELIAQHPPAQRSGGRMLVVDPASDCLADARIEEFPQYVQARDLLVFNDTRVIPARLFGQKDSGGRVEVLIERLLDSAHALAHVRASKSPKPGCLLSLADGQLSARVSGREGELFRLAFASEDLLSDLQRLGRMPLPPYIERDADTGDNERYQTVFSREPGAVAAPTAGLHFDQAMLARLSALGVESQYLTLHVGAGTFQPVRVESLEKHHMHAERVIVTEAVCEAVARCRARGGRVIAVGTTVMRSLETAAQAGELRPLEGESRLFITPGFPFRVVDAMLTNFHLPRSTLLMLVSAFAGHQRVLQAYRHAVAQRYRFFSYGDAMWISGRDPALS